MRTLQSAVEWRRFDRTHLISNRTSFYSLTLYCTIQPPPISKSLFNNATDPDGVSLFCKKNIKASFKLIRIRFQIDFSAIWKI